MADEPVKNSSAVPGKMLTWRLLAGCGFKLWRQRMGEIVWQG